MSDQTSKQPEPATLIFKGRIEKLMREKKLSYVDALKESLKDEADDEYAARNERAVQEAIDMLDSPEYLKRVSEILEDPDPLSREAKRAKLLEENCAALDLGALHRHVRDNQERLKESGVIPRIIRSLEDLPENSLQLSDAQCPNCLRANTTWLGQEHSFLYWFCDVCGNSDTERAKSQPQT